MAFQLYDKSIKKTTLLTRSIPSNDSLFLYGEWAGGRETYPFPAEEVDEGWEGSLTRIELSEQRWI